MTKTTRTTLAMTSQTISLTAHGGPEVMQLIEVAVPQPGPHEVTLRQYAIGLNFVDIYYRSGLYPHALPHGLGVEAAGVVEKVGDAVTHLQKGDRVAYGQSPLGAYAQRRNVPAQHVVKLPHAISFDEAAALMLKGLTVQYLFRQTYRLQGHETILFHAAAGGVGLIACQWARALGVKLIGTVSNAEKAALARAHGAWAVIDTSREDIVERVHALTHGEKVPVVYDGVGLDTWEASLNCIAPRGLMVSFGNASGPVANFNVSILNQKGSLYLTRPSLEVHVNTLEKLNAAANELFGWVIEKKIQVRIDQRYPLAQAGRAQAALAARQTTGATILTLT
jgi:NADPH2:quinone reductase